MRGSGRQGTGRGGGVLWDNGATFPAPTQVRGRRRAASQ